MQSINTIPTTQKQEVYPTYQPVQQAQYIPVQYVQKPFYVPQQQPAAMIILAQPAIVPQQMLYSGSVQQLLNYFHGNPQAKYQFLSGYQPQPTTQTLLPQSPSTAATIGNYQYVAAPTQNLVASPSVHSQSSSYNSIPSMSLSAISNLAQLQAQQYTHYTPSFPTSLRSIPPIITGLENFTPEQQAQIKAQLNSHLGGSSLNTISTNTVAPTPQTGTVIPTPQSAILTTTQGQHPTISTAQGQISNMAQMQKYSAQIQTNDFMQEKDEKSETDSSTVYTPSMNYRGQYTKG